MKDSYKKRLYTNVISLSAVVLVAVLTQGTAAADTQDSTETQPIANKTETVVPAEKSTKTNTTEATATPDSSPAEAQLPTTNNQEEAQKSESAPSIDSSASTTNESGTETPAKPETRAAETEEKKVQLANSTVHMSEKATITETVQEQGATAGKISWKLDNKPIAEWKTWNMEKGDFSGDSFVTIEETTNGSDLKLSLKFNELFGKDLSLRTPNNIRRTYRQFIGNHELVGTDEESGLTIRKTLVFRPYENFHTHEEMLAAIEKSRQEAKNDRLVKIEDIGTSAQGRKIKLGIISSDQKSIDDYLNSTNKMALTKPAEMLAALKDGK